MAAFGKNLQSSADLQQTAYRVNEQTNISQTDITQIDITQIDISQSDVGTNSIIQNPTLVRMGLLRTRCGVDVSQNSEQNKT